MLLVLPIKKKWFDMIRSGEKKEEYREIKQYYTSRFQNIGLLNEFGKPTNNTEWIVFRNGYSEESPSFQAKCRLSVKVGKAEWGAEEGKTYYALKIGIMIDLTNSI